MATIAQARFDEFLRDIEPSTRRRKRMPRLHIRIYGAFCDMIQILPEKFGVNDFLSGSYKRDTSIRPRVKNGETTRPDVDIIVVTNHSQSDNPKSVVDLLYYVLRNKYPEIRRQTRSVGISYYKADMDVVPVKLALELHIFSQTASKSVGFRLIHLNILLGPSR